MDGGMDDDGGTKQEEVPGLFLKVTMSLLQDHIKGDEAEIFISTSLPTNNL